MPDSGLFPDLLPNELRAFPGEKDLANDEIPSKPPNKSAFSAGNTDAVDLYRLGEINAIVAVINVQIKINLEINFLYFVKTEIKSSKTLPGISVPVLMSIFFLCFIYHYKIPI